jgi:hypothetical protein
MALSLLSLWDTCRGHYAEVIANATPLGFKIWLPGMCRSWTQYKWCKLACCRSKGKRRAPPLNDVRPAGSGPLGCCSGGLTLQVARVRVLGAGARLPLREPALQGRRSIRRRRQLRREEEAQEAPGACTRYRPNSRTTLGVTGVALSHENTESSAPNRRLSTHRNLFFMHRRLTRPGPGRKQGRVRETCRNVERRPGPRVGLEMPSGVGNLRCTPYVVNSCHARAKSTPCLDRPCSRRRAAAAASRSSPSTTSTGAELG